MLLRASPGNHVRNVSPHPEGVPQKPKPRVRSNRKYWCFSFVMSRPRQTNTRFKSHSLGYRKRQNVPLNLSVRIDKISRVKSKGGVLHEPGAPHPETLAGRDVDSLDFSSVVRSEDHQVVSADHVRVVVPVFVPPARLPVDEEQGSSRSERFPCSLLDHLTSSVSTSNESSVM